MLSQRARKTTQKGEVVLLKKTSLKQTLKLLLVPLVPRLAKQGLAQMFQDLFQTDPVRIWNTVWWHTGCRIGVNSSSYWGWPHTCSHQEALYQEEERCSKTASLEDAFLLEPSLSYSNRSSRRFLDIWELMLVILTTLPSGEMQIIRYLLRLIRIASIYWQHSDPSDVHSKDKM